MSLHASEGVSSIHASGHISLSLFPSHPTRRNCAYLVCLLCHLEPSVITCNSLSQCGTASRMATTAAAAAASGTAGSPEGGAPRGLVVLAMPAAGPLSSRRPASREERGSSSPVEPPMSPPSSLWVPLALFVPFLEASAPCGVVRHQRELAGTPDY